MSNSNAPIHIYGIKSCNSMKKAFTKLEELAVAYQFHDYKKQGIDRDSLQRWVDQLGLEKVLNKKGTTWRKLTDEQKASADADTNAAIELMLENTSMIKRPIVEGQWQKAQSKTQVLLCGFNEEEFEQAFAEQ